MVQPLAKFISLAVSAALIQGVLIQKVLIQTAPLTTPANSSDPLISRESNVAIYIGLALLILAVGFAIKNVSYRLERVLLFAFTLTVIFLLILWYL